MDISSLSASPPGTSASVRSASATPEAAEKLRKTFELAAVVSDDSGKYSLGEQAAAYERLFANVVTGVLAGVSADDRKAVEHALGYSTFGKRLMALEREYGANFASVMNAGGNVARACVDFYDALSADDKTVFEAFINPTDESNKKKFGSVEGWRTTYLALAEYHDYDRQAKASGLTESDEKFAKVQALMSQDVRGANFNEIWGQALLDLLRQPADRVQLSDEAKAMLGGAKFEPRETFMPAKAQGSLLNTTA